MLDRMIERLSRAKNKKEAVVSYLPMNDFLDNYTKSIDRSLALSMIEMFGGWELFQLHTKSKREDVDFETIDEAKILSLLAEDKEALLYNLAKDRIFIDASTLGKYKPIADNDVRISVKRLMETLGSGAPYDDTPAVDVQIAKIVTYPAAERLCLEMRSRNENSEPYSPIDMARVVRPISDALGGGIIFRKNAIVISVNPSPVSVFDEYLTDEQTVVLFNEIRNYVDSDALGWIHIDALEHASNRHPVLGDAKPINMHALLNASNAKIGYIRRLPEDVQLQVAKLLIGIAIQPLYKDFAIYSIVN